jgi:hypothetical protein
MINFFNFFFIKNYLQFTYPKNSINNVQATKEAFSPKKRTSSTSKHEISELFSICVGHFYPSGSGSGFRNTDQCKTDDLSNINYLWKNVTYVRPASHHGGEGEEAGWRQPEADRRHHEARRRQHRPDRLGFRFRRTAPPALPLPDRLCGEMEFSMDTVIWGNTGRVTYFKVIINIVRNGFWQFFFHKKVNELCNFPFQCLFDGFGMESSNFFFK